MFTTSSKILSLSLLLSCVSTATGFVVDPVSKSMTPPAFTTTSLNLFDDKMWEKEGTLGKGITVGKVQISLNSPDRSKGSIFGMLEEEANSDDGTLAEFANSVCLALLRKKDCWTAAYSSSKWFKADDWGKAESYYNDLSNQEAMKYEKEYVPDEDDEVKSGGPTEVVVSLIVEIQGDATKFDRAGYSMMETQEVLASIASDVLVDDGELLNAVEVFWTPSARDEVLSSRDLIVDFPELITL